jgi:DNA polymerase III sliding clamp (beta) subunit (PCNA family)
MRTQITVNGHDLLCALQAARRTVSTDPEVPMLGGVFLDIDSESEVLRVVATDRYRLLVIPVDGTELAGTSKGVIAPLGLIDDATAALSSETGPVTLSLEGDRIVIASSTGPVAQAPLLDYDFPDYRRAIRNGSRIALRVDADRLRSDLAEAPTTAMRRDGDGVDYDLVTLNVDADDRLIVAAGIDGVLQVGVNREFLLQALEGVAADDLTLELDGPIAPLVIRDAARADVTSMLMPVRLDGTDHPS